MKLSEWVRDNYTRVTLMQDICSKTLSNGSVVRVKTSELNRDLTIGLLSTNTKDEWKRIVFHHAPLGIIVDDIPQDYYDEKITLLRAELTKMLFDAKNTRLIEQYIKILERRDREHWREDKSKTTSVQATQGDLNVKFEIVDAT